MPPGSFSYKKSRDLNDKNHMLDLSTRTKLYLRDRLHDRNKKVRSDTPFFKSNGALPADGLTKKKTEPIPAGEII
jgi:hypothetical protein